MVVTANLRGASSTSLIHGPGSPLVDVARLCSRIAASEATVMITGETGTGKEVFARLIHARSPRADRALVPVNCAAIPEALLESELFGYVRGAFTGAFQSRRGRLALAEGGTLFLDEIGELPLSLQAKLLRVIQERSYEPVGSTEPVPADFRLVVATNRDLAAEVEAGRFRQDLFYRLLVCPIELPPLRERRGDIAPLFLHFWLARGEKREILPAALAALGGYDWPGNVRELENLVERISICSEGEVIGLADLPPEVRRAPALLYPLQAPAGSRATIEGENDELRRTLRDLSSDSYDDGGEAAQASDPAAVEILDAAESNGSPAQAPSEEMPPAETVAAVAARAQSEEGEAPQRPLESLEEDPALGLPMSLPTLLRSIEERYIRAALEQVGGNRKAAADLLGLQRTTLVEKLRRQSRDASAQRD